MQDDFQDKSNFRFRTRHIKPRTLEDIALQGPFAELPFKPGLFRVVILCPLTHGRQARRSCCHFRMDSISRLKSFFAQTTGTGYSGFASFLAQVIICSISLS